MNDHLSEGALMFHEGINALVIITRVAAPGLDYVLYAVGRHSEPMVGYYTSRREIWLGDGWVECCDVP